MTPSFTYAAKIERVVDADTLDVELDLGMRIQFRVRLRLAHVDTPELRTPEGKVARAYVLELLCIASGEHGESGHASCRFRPVVVTTHKPDKFGRALADVKFVGRDGATHDLAEELLTAGYGAAYEGGRR